MIRDLPRGELRYLLSLGGIVVGLATATVGLWWSPWSPVVLDRAAVHLAEGDVDGAVGDYLALADGLAFESVRAEALWRAALLTAVDRGDVQGGIDLLRAYKARFPDASHVGEADAQLASLYQQHLGDDLRAGEAWESAAASDPGHPEAGAWLVDAGLAYAHAGLVERAAEALGAAARHQGQRVNAALALARLHLPTDPAGAYAWYDTALMAGASGEAARLARFGMATALEQMDRAEEALAELDSVAGEEDDEALQRRRTRLRARVAR